MVKLAAFLVIIALLFGVGAVRGLFSFTVGVVVFVIIATIVCVIAYGVGKGVKAVSPEKEVKVKGADGKIRTERRKSYSWLFVILAIIVAVLVYRDSTSYNYAYTYQFDGGDTSIYSFASSIKYYSISECETAYRAWRSKYGNGTTIVNAYCGHNCKVDNVFITCDSKESQLEHNDARTFLDSYLRKARALPLISSSA